MATNAITHVVFDMDGTVVDSESLLFSACHEVCAKYGKSAPKPVLEELLGHPFKERSLQLFTDLGFEAILSFESFVSQIISDCLSNVRENGMKLMPGIESLVQYFQQNHIPMAIATGNDRKSYEETAKRFEPFFDHFSHVVLSGDEKERISPKPNPDIYIQAFERFSPKPESFLNVLVFEDSEVGVLSAISAGMKCVHVLDQRLSSAKDSKIATLLINSLDEFKPEMFGLPQRHAQRESHRL